MYEQKKYYMCSLWKGLKQNVGKCKTTAIINTFIQIRWDLSHDSAKPQSESVQHICNAEILNHQAQEIQ